MQVIGMTDSISLAGTIGTWVAVFLGVVALAGILPTWWLIRTSRQAKNQALAAVDDPTGGFVSRGFDAPWLRGFRKVKIPDLTKPPQFTPSQPSQLRNPTPKLIPDVEDGSRSTTGWINFLRIVSGMFTELDYATGTQALGYRYGRQSFFPVHRGWLFVFAIMHRFAYREDFGLPLESVGDPELNLVDPKRTLSGLSGVLAPQSQGRRFGNTNTVIFTAHELADIRLNLQKESIPLSNLCYMSIGLLPGSDGTLWDVDLRSSYSRTRTRVRRDPSRPTILHFMYSRDPVSREMRFIRSLGLLAKDVRTLKPIVDRELESELAAGATSESTAKYLHIGSVKRDGESFNCWILREDLYRILLIYLRSPMSPLGFLYGYKSDVILRYALQPKALTALFEVVRASLRDMELNEAQRTALKSSLEHVTSSSVQEVLDSKWSRTAMTGLWTLDQALSKVPKSNDPRALAVSMLYMFERRFQEGIVRCMQDDLRTPTKHVLINVQQGIIRLPDAEQRADHQDFQFDFMAALGHTCGAEITILTDRNTNNELSLPLLDCALACLRGHVRVTMWKMSLDPIGLSDFLNLVSDERVVYISSDTDVEEQDRPLISPPPSDASSNGEDTDRGFDLPLEGDPGNRSDSFGRDSYDYGAEMYALRQELRDPRRYRRAGLQFVDMPIPPPRRFERRHRESQIGQPIPERGLQRSRTQ